MIFFIIAKSVSKDNKAKFWQKIWPKWQKSGKSIGTQ